MMKNRPRKLVMLEKFFYEDKLYYRKNMAVLMNVSDKAIL
jgi:hypothetical protein